MHAAFAHIETALPPFDACAKLAPMRFSFADVIKVAWAGGPTAAEGADGDNPALATVPRSVPGPQETKTRVPNEIGVVKY